MKYNSMHVFQGQFVTYILFLLPIISFILTLDISNNINGDLSSSTTKISSSITPVTTLSTKNASIGTSRLPIPNSPNLAPLLLDATPGTIPKSVNCINPNPECPCIPQYRSINGVCNNPVNKDWGSVMQPHGRLLPPQYSDGLSTLRISVTGNPLPSPRTISTNIFAAFADSDSKQSSIMAMLWGQFIDHDFTKTSIASKDDGTTLECCSLDRGDPSCEVVDVTSDSFFQKFDVRCLGFARSAKGNSSGPREQINELTPFLDASMVYGVSADRQKALRTFTIGQLKSSFGPSGPTRKPLMPLLPADDPFCQGQATSQSNKCTLAGDDRFSEQVGLSILHILLLREHNRIAEKLATINPQWTDETTYQEARKLVGAMVQKITYDEYLPAILGRQVMKSSGLQLKPFSYYTGYKKDLKPGLTSEFITAAYRFGHSMIPAKYECLDENYKSIPGVKPIPMREAFLDNFFFFEQTKIPVEVNALDCLIRGQISKPSKNVDQIITGEVRNHLFESGNPFGLDLATLNVLRGRDHGLPTYVQMRDFCNLSPIHSFEDLVGIVPNKTIPNLANTYDSVEDMDLFPLGLAEIPINGALVGPTFSCIITRQFRALRDSDAFWFENSKPKIMFKTSQLNEITKVSLARLICDNSDNIGTIHSEPFKIPHNIWNPLMPCFVYPSIDLNAWKTSSKT